MTGVQRSALPISQPMGLSVSPSRGVRSCAVTLPELERSLTEAGWADAPAELSARLRELVAAELSRGSRSLGRGRSAFPETRLAGGVPPAERAVLAALPVSVE